MKRLLFLIGAIALLVGLFLIFKPQNQEADSNQKSFSLEIKDKKIVTGLTTLKVSEGNNVTIKITNDETEEFHLHGYDRSVDLVPNTETELTFTANLTGRFIFELENSKTELGALEVQPK